MDDHQLDQACAALSAYTSMLEIMLTRQQSELFELVYCGGCSVIEAAKDLGISVEEAQTEYQVMMMLSRECARLASELSNRFEMPRVFYVDGKDRASRSAHA